MVSSVSDATAHPCENAPNLKNRINYAVLLPISSRTDVVRLKGGGISEMSKGA